MPIPYDCRTCGHQSLHEMAEIEAPPCPVCGDTAMIMARWNHEDPLMQRLAREIARARQLHPGNPGLFAALAEEQGELARELLASTIDWERVAEEALQVACVAIRIAREKVDLAQEDHAILHKACENEAAARAYFEARGIA